MFERYVLYSDLQGMSEQHWEKLYSEYNDITGDGSVMSTVMNMGQYSALSLKLDRINVLLYAIELTYDEGLSEQVDISVLIKAARAEFKQLPMAFSPESYKKDITLCLNFSKDLTRQHKALEEILLKDKGEKSDGKTYFDNVLMTYSKHYSTPMLLKKDTSTQTFALIVKDLNNASRPN